MAGSRVARPLCQATNPQILDEGTMCLASSPVPGPVGVRRANDDESLLDEALAGLEAEAETFAWRFINDARARQAYVTRIRAMSDQILKDVRSGLVSAEEGAAFANRMRNAIMDEIRGATSAIGRVGAEAAKVSGQTLEEGIEKASKKLFPGKTFAELSTAQKRQVFMEVVEASGRSSSRVSSRIPAWTRLGRGLIVVTVAISAVNIWMAKNKVKQGIKEGATLLGGALGGAAASASAGFLCGPGAPVCVTVLFIVGGVAGAIIANSAAEVALDQQDIVSWLGE